MDRSLLRIAEATGIKESQSLVSIGKVGIRRHAEKAGAV
jgi:hypothetical protein